MTDKLTIAHWAEEDKPREKLDRLGASALSNAELLAILIGSGSTDQSAVDLMKTILRDCGGSLGTLGKKTALELQAYKGVGPAKAITILAACELGKRRASEKVGERPLLADSAAVYRYMHPLIQDLDVEEAWVLLMNNSFRLIKAAKLSHGGLTETAVDVRVVVKEALLAGATVVTLIHNHPSGNPQPSGADDRLTEATRKACEVMRLCLADHVVICDGSYYSYHDKGRV